MSALTLGRIFFGTMRLGDVDRSQPEWVDFFAGLHEMGIRKIHSSSEYDTFPMLCEILRELQSSKNISFRHIVKLAEPSFDDNDFSATRLEEKVDHYLRSLAASQIDDVQWMWRNQLDDDESRIRAFVERLDDITTVAQKLKADSKIGRFMCFPYSREFAAEAAEHRAVDGLLVYRNALEREYDDIILRCSKISKAVIVIRPLNAGKVLEEGTKTPAEHFRDSLDLQAVEAGIVSSNDLNHLREITVG